MGYTQNKNYIDKKDLEHFWVAEAINTKQDKTLSNEVAEALSGDGEEVRTLDDALLRLNEKAGTGGEPGFSPTVEVTKTGKVTTVTITDKTGAHTATINDGEDGVSPTISAVRVSNGVQLTITDKNGSHSAVLNDGIGDGSTVATFADVPSDGKSYLRQNGIWVEGATKQELAEIKTEVGELSNIVDDVISVPSCEVLHEPFYCKDKKWFFADGEPIDGCNIWNIGDNFFYSDWDKQYILNLNGKFTANNKWEKISWGGLTSFHKKYIWTDGTDTYYSHRGQQYVLDNTQLQQNYFCTWSVASWNGLTKFNGDNVWTDGVNIYYSVGQNHYVLNKATKTWEVKVWNGLTNFNGRFVWTYNGNVFYSNRKIQYKLNQTSGIWEAKVWDNLTNFSATSLWTDCTHTYYNGGKAEDVTWSKENDAILSTITKKVGDAPMQLADLGYPNAVSVESSNPAIVRVEGTTIYIDALYYDGQGEYVPQCAILTLLDSIGDVVSYVKIDITPEAVIADKVEYTNPYDTWFDTVTYSRTFSDKTLNVWQAFCVPFSFNVADFEGQILLGEQVKTVGSKDTTIPVEGYTKPSFPYLCKAKQNNIELRVSNCVLKSADERMTEVKGDDGSVGCLIGVLRSKFLRPYDGNYYLATNGNFSTRTASPITMTANRILYRKDSLKDFFTSSDYPSGTFVLLDDLVWYDKKWDKRVYGEYMWNYEGITYYSNGDEQYSITQKYDTQHKEELQSKLVAGENIIIKNNVISYTPRMVEIETDEDGNKGGYLGEEFFNMCVKNPALLMDIVFYEWNDSEDEEGKHADHNYGKPTWIRFDKTERSGEVVECAFIISVYNMGDFCFFSDGKIEPLGE